MARSTRSAERIARRNKNRAERYASLVAQDEQRDQEPPQRSPLVPHPKAYEAQADLIDSLDNASQVFVTGPAGTGKTYVMTVHAADRLADKKIDTIVLTRPNVEAGRSIGFRPGTMEEKMAEWFAEVLAILRKRLGGGFFDYCMKKKKIELVPFETMRGRSWSNAVILLDEAQNTTVSEMEMFLTRQGEGSQVVVNGDLMQDDLKGTHSGLEWALDMVEKYDLSADIVEFDENDIVRSGNCAEWVRVMYKEGRAQ